MNSFDIHEFVKDAGGEDQVIITAEMPYKGIGVPHMRFCLTDSDTRPQMCMLYRDPKKELSDLYNLDGNYKLEIISLETGFKQKYYISDFNSLVIRGYIKVEVKPAFFDPDTVKTDLSGIRIPRL